MRSTLQLFLLLFSSSFVFYLFCSCMWKKERWEKKMNRINLSDFQCFNAINIWRKRTKKKHVRKIEKKTTIVEVLRAFIYLYSRIAWQGVRCVRPILNIYIYICMMYDVSEKIRLKSVQRYIREYEITNKLELYVRWERRWTSLNFVRWKMVRKIIKLSTTIFKVNC